MNGGKPTPFYPPTDYLGYPPPVRYPHLLYNWERSEWSVNIVQKMQPILGINPFFT